MQEHSNAYIFYKRYCTLLVYTIAKHNNYQLKRYENDKLQAQKSNKLHILNNIRNNYSLFLFVLCCCAVCHSSLDKIELLRTKLLSQYQQQYIQLQKSTQPTSPEPPSEIEV
jgi:hypothetical protein